MLYLLTYLLGLITGVVAITAAKSLAVVGLLLALVIIGLGYHRHQKRKRVS